MSSICIEYKGSSFWIHNGCAEIWLYGVAEELTNGEVIAPQLIEYRLKIRESLEAGWVDGIIMSGFETYLSSTDVLTEFLLVAHKVASQLKDQAHHTAAVKLGEYTATREFLLPELDMLNILLSSPESVPKPPQIFILGRGWQTV